jgi:DNA-binding response OmpR family regulator
VEKGGVMSRTVLVVDDDRNIVHLVQVYLVKEGFRVLVAYDGREALEQARKHHPDLIVLDLMLPEIDGLQVCQHIRVESNVPIIMLTAKTTEDDKLVGLHLGADDYVTKPFSPRELVARVEAVLRRTATSEPPEADICLGNIVISTTRHSASVGNRTLELTPSEFKLLETMVRNPGRVFTRTQLVELALGDDYEGLERTIDVHIMNLRRKLEPDRTKPAYIKTVLGIGYKLEVPADAS